MGWLWASSSSPAKPPTANDKSAPITPHKPASTESDVDPEIQKFLELFKAETSGPKQDNNTSPNATPSSSQQAQSSPSTVSSWLSLKASKSAEEAPNAPTRDRVSEALLPTEMSCRQAFDLAWSCNSVGGQWNAVYRHGEMRACSEQWDDFWFCMRTKSHTGELKERAVKQHYRNKEHAKYYAPGKHSSEDIWEVRSELLPPQSAFIQPIDGPTIDDDEWRRQESDRRRGIRAGLGYDNTSS